MALMAVVAVGQRLPSVDPPDAEALGNRYDRCASLDAYFQTI